MIRRTSPLCRHIVHERQAFCDLWNGHKNGYRPEGMFDMYNGRQGVFNCIPSDWVTIKHYWLYDDLLDIKKALIFMDGGHSMWHIIF